MRDNRKYKKTGKKKKRRLKKGVRRGCAVFFWILVLSLGSLVWNAVSPSFGDSIEEDTVAVEEEPYIAPEDTADVDPALTERLAHYVETAPRIEKSRLGVYVYDITAREDVYGHRDTVPMIPASCTKLLTASVALHHLGPDHAYDSSLLMYGSVSKGTLYGSLIVSMDDDPFFPSFDEFVQSLCRKGINHIEGSIVFDLARTDTLRQHHTASPWDISYNKVPLLMKGAPRIRREFMNALSTQGITYHPNPLLAHPWLQGLSKDEDPAEYRLALSLARSQSEILARTTHSLRSVLFPVLMYSDNILAEAVHYHIGHAYDRWTGGGWSTQELTEKFLREELQIPSGEKKNLIVYDGSGLAPANRFTSRFLVQLLTYAYDHPVMQKVFIDELLPSPLPNRRGTLSGRMKSEKVHGRVFAKTGTLAAKGVSSLSGYCLGRNGHWYAFAILHEDMAIYEARIFQDRLCELLVK